MFLVILGPLGIINGNTTCLGRAGPMLDLLLNSPIEIYIYNHYIYLAFYYFISVYLTLIILYIIDNIFTQFYKYTFVSLVIRQ